LHWIRARIAARLSAKRKHTLPRVKSGSIVMFGEIFGGRIDNIHTAIGIETRNSDGALVVRFDDGERLTVLNPQNVSISETEFRIERATAVTWEWFYYGREQTPENLYFKRYVVSDSGLGITDNVDYYDVRQSASLDAPAVEIL